MRIPSFRVENQRNIQLAECNEVPQIMIVTGPNGCGKSTLLQSLRTPQGGTRPMYVGPHRSSRRQIIRYQNLGAKLQMREVLEGENLQNYPGIETMTRTRTPWDHDEAASYIKYGICQIEQDRREAIATRYDHSKEISKDSLPDVWAPLRELTNNLLPHLSFERVDTSNKSQVQCLWKVHGGDNLIDVDDLSSGEKSIIQLFYPLVEHRIRGRLQALEGETGNQESQPICVLIDEPELHLHPNLQTKILDYLRTISTRENAQFIIATHSTTIVENANSDELYLLQPSETVSLGENQLLKIANDEAKLEVLRGVFGSTSNLTALRPIVVVEGKREASHSRRAADSRIYAFLGDEFNKLTMLPAGGKHECKRLVDNLNGILADISLEIRAHALLDRDLEESEPESKYMHLLPVSMVENLLVDPHVIWRATEPVHHKMALANETEVEDAIGEILDELEPDEAARRTKARIGTKVFRLKDPIEEASAQLEAFAESLRADLADERLCEIKKQSAEKVKIIGDSNKRREYFHGKRILDEFFKRHMHETGMSTEIFIYQCALYAKQRTSVKTFVADLMASLGVREQPEDQSP